MLDLLHRDQVEQLSQREIQRLLIAQPDPQSVPDEPLGLD